MARQVLLAQRQLTRRGSPQFIGLCPRPAEFRLCWTPSDFRPGAAFQPPECDL